MLPRDDLISSSPNPHFVTGAVIISVTYGETEVQRGLVTHYRSHSQGVVELEVQP